VVRRIIFYNPEMGPGGPVLTMAENYKNHLISLTLICSP
jgi:hypothetical protein